MADVHHEIEALARGCAGCADREVLLADLLAALLRVLDYGPCPCGVWQDRLAERPHVLGCLVIEAIAKATSKPEEGDIR